MKLSKEIGLTIVAGMLAAACGGAGTQSAPPPQQKPAAPPTTAAAQPPAATTTASEFGVKECDDYIQKYLACIDKAPEAARAMVRQSLDQTKAQWKHAAATPQGKASLASGCKMAHDMAKQSMSAYGCQW
jgi:hypothetical protein